MNVQSQCMSGCRSTVKSRLQIKMFVEVDIQMFQKNGGPLYSGSRRTEHFSPTSDSSLSIYTASPYASLLF